jgi:hypothetical protein
MIQYFDINIERDAVEHAKNEYPNESCGIIVNNKYIPCENVSDNKRWNFEIDKHLIAKHTIAGDLQCVIHSHVDEVGKNKDTGQKYVADYGHASKDDMIRQAAMMVPFGIVHLNIDGSHVKTFYFGDQLPTQELKGRTFIHGVYDCYGLLRDYYKRIFEITLPQFPRYFGWWNDKKNSSMLTDYAEQADFHRVEINEYNKYKHGDAVFMTILSHTVNHCSVYTDNGLIMHHLCDRLSCEQPLMNFRNSISCVYRYKEFM